MLWQFQVYLTFLGKSKDLTTRSGIWYRFHDQHTSTIVLTLTRFFLKVPRQAQNTWSFLHPRLPPLWPFCMHRDYYKCNFGNVWRPLCGWENKPWPLQSISGLSELFAACSPRVKVKALFCQISLRPLPFCDSMTWLLVEKYMCAYTHMYTTETYILFFFPQPKWVELERNPA